MRLPIDKLLSVIIPVYNVESYLPSCLDSVISQSYGNMEILLVDDGSDDSSGEICDRYAAMDSRIRVFHTVNSGVSAARNLALSQIRGKWVAFVDSDDLVPAGTFSKYVAIAEKEGVDVVVGSIRYDLDTAGSDVFIDSYESRTYWSDMSETCLMETIRNFKMAVMGKLFTSEMLRDIRFPKGIPNYEDYTVLWQLALKRPNYTTVNQVGYIARYRPGSASRSLNGLSTYRKRITSLSYACEKMKELFSSFPKVRRNLTRFVIDEGLGCRSLYGNFNTEDAYDVKILTMRLWQIMQDTCMLPWYVRWPLAIRVRTVGTDVNKFPMFSYVSIRIALRLL